MLWCSEIKANKTESIKFHLEVNTELAVEILQDNLFEKSGINGWQSQISILLQEN